MANELPFRKVASQTLVSESPETLAPPLRTVRAYLEAVGAHWDFLGGFWGWRRFL